MNWSARRRMSWLGVGVLAALLGTLSLPAGARASCGDYVVVGGSSARSMHPDHDGQPAHGAGKVAPNSDPTHKRPAPCSGPHCSRNPAPSPPEPITTVIVTGEQWASLPACALPDLPPLALPRPEYHAGGPVRHHSIIYHPPRPPFPASRS